MQYLFQRPLCVYLLFLVAQVSMSLQADVTWDSPSVGDVYIPGDTLQVVWKSPDKVVSPSFTICTGTDDNSTTSANRSTDCGTAVWPSVDQNGTEYSISLAIPNITGNGSYFLVMKDDRGIMYDTPNFSLALANNTSDTKNTTATSNTPQPASTDITYVPSHSSSAAAAIAIPLSLVAAVLLGALLLLIFRTRRSGQLERDKEKQFQIARETESRSRLNQMNFASATDIEHAILALSANRGYDGAASFAHGPPPVGMRSAYAGPGLGAAALGTGAFGWTHGSGAAAPVVPPVSDAYTPAPVMRHPTGSSARSISRPQSMYGYHEQEKFRGPTDWLGHDWRSSQQTLADEMPQYYSGLPQLPAIQIYASSPTVRADVPPPLLPKQLFPGRLDIHARRAYTPPYGSSLVASETSLPPTPGKEVHTSLNVISNYMQASPAPPQLHPLYPTEQTSELSVPHVPPPSLLRAQTLRSLETSPEHEENDKPLPSRPEASGGTNLYGAVSKAISGWRS